MNEQQLRSAVDLGMYAGQVLENPAFEEAWRRMRDGIHARWLEIPVRDTDAQQLMLQQAKLVDLLRGELQMLIEGGKSAKLSLPEASKDLRTKDPEKLQPIEREIARVRQLRPRR